MQCCLRCFRGPSIVSCSIMKVGPGGAGKLFALGLLIHGGVATEGFPAWDLARVRVYGVLQRIAVCFLMASLLAIFVPESRLPKPEVGDHSHSACLARRCCMDRPWHFYSSFRPRDSKLCNISWPYMHKRQRSLSILTCQPLLWAL